MNADVYLREAELWFAEMNSQTPIWQRHHAELRMWECLLFWAICAEAA